MFINEEIEKDLFFKYYSRDWISPDDDIKFLLVNKRDFQVVDSVNRMISIETEDLNTIKKLILDNIFSLTDLGNDFTREPSFVIKDGEEDVFVIKNDGELKELSVWNLWSYKEERGLNPSIDILLNTIEKINVILSKYETTIEVFQDDNENES